MDPRSIPATLEGMRSIVGDGNAQGANNHTAKLDNLGLS
jgi:hypothetical protein